MCEILGARSEFLDVPCNKIIPTMEMKMTLVNALRRLKANIVLFPTPWDCHADHRNLSWTMRDVVYYVGHRGIEADYPPSALRGAYMYDLEWDVYELREPDFVVDVSAYAEANFRAIQCEARAAVFGAESGKLFSKWYEIWTGFWGMRNGVEFAEPLWHAYGSMGTMYASRKLTLRSDLPLQSL